MRSRLLAAAVLSLALGGHSGARGDSGGTVRVHVRTGAAALSRAEVRAGDRTALTDERGDARLDLPAGDHDVSVIHPGFAPAELRVTIAEASETAVTVELRALPSETTAVVVTATRSDRIVDDQPIRVEAVPEAEIEENLTVAPGNVTTLLEELAGLRVQAVSAGLGGASLRVRGLRGRYTQVLMDDLPLMGRQPDTLALLQMPPLDLGRVEVVKGTVSALYGGTGIGGLVNLVSRRPGSEPELLVSQGSRGATDVVGFGSLSLGPHSGFTLSGSLDRQPVKDLDGDGWSEIAGYRRGTFRPRFYWDDARGNSVFATAGGTYETRESGTQGGAVDPSGSPYPEAADTRHLDGGLVGRFPVGKGRLVTLRTSAATTGRDRTFGSAHEQDRRTFAQSEVTCSGSDRGHGWLVGAALEQDRYRIEGPVGLDYTHTTPAVFVQDEYAISRPFAVSLSLRAESPHGYETLVDPRLSFLVRPDEAWSLRLSAGTGHTLPVPFVEETDAVGLSRVLPMQSTRPERARSASLDAEWRHGGVEASVSFFAAEVREPLLLRPAAAPAAADALEIVNAASPTRSHGAELLLRWTHGPLQTIASGTFARGTEANRDGPGTRELLLTPRETAEIAAILEDEERGRIGLEVGYVGRQALDDDPYRSESVPYVEVSFLAEVRVRSVRLFVNAVNLGNVRQSRYDPLLLPVKSPIGLWTAPVWAPLDGIVVNVGARIEF